MNTLCEIKVSYNPKTKRSDLPKISSSKDIYNVLMQSFNMDTINLQEECILVLLNRSNKVLGFKSISTGGVAGTLIDPKIVFSIALKGVASSIILAHNHPSGSLKPSDADRRLTSKLKEAGLLLELPLLDHIIISDEGYYSFADEGIL